MQNNNEPAEYNLIFTRDVIFWVRGYGMVRFNCGDKGTFKALETRFLLADGHAVIEENNG